MFSFLSKKRMVVVSPSIVVFTVFFLLGLYFLYYIKWILLLLLTAFILSVALRPAVNKIQKSLKFPLVVSVALVYMFMVLIFAGLLGLLIPPLAQQLVELLKTLDIPLLQNELRNFKFSLSELNGFAKDLGGSITILFSIITSTFNGIFTFFTLLVMAFYLTLERPKLHHKITWFSKKKLHLKTTEEFLSSVERQLGGWVRGQLILMISIGVVTYVGLSIFKVPFALPLALIAGFLEILPNLGPTLAAVPAVFIAFVAGSQDPVQAGIVALFYIFVQQMENNFLVPKVMQDNADVNPLITIMVILIGLQAAGFLGALLAVPVYIVLRTFYSIWLRDYFLQQDL